MSKKKVDRLEWFKFFPADWLGGSVQLLSDAEKGTFIDLIAMIWKEGGSLEISKVLHRKLKLDHTTACERINSYCDLEILHCENNTLSMKFIDNQLSDINKTKETNKKNADIRWKKEAEKKVDNATASSRMPIREEQIREEEIREDTEEENKDTPSSTSEKPIDPKYLSFCKYYYDKLAEAGNAGFISKIKKNVNCKSKGWLDSIRLLETADGVEWHRIQKVARWYFDHNIKSNYATQAYSMSSLREKFNSMESNMKKDNPSFEMPQLSLMDQVKHDKGMM